ncbi:uncharacterized protein E0L32_007590 [Thyridium curvatum]|uniref:Endo-chitosanase n=1 Tax=Thyridium curvatum TaxID=1093900 RepID=A0A507B3H8_9PEZI|nr:uncharacterized protein E0L32_007590 [Thyridium curvatum]TPX11611.1 hypothetical protein E0L32_007590 [Thyridium curvatum]
MRSILFSAALLAAAVSARDVPTNVRNFYNSVKNAGACSKKIGPGFYSTDGGSGNYYYCGDHKDDYNVIYLKGPGSQFVNMDIDCDGDRSGPGNDGRCNGDGTSQDITSFQYIVKGYNKGINDLNPFVHPYVVFGNVGQGNQFDPQAHGIKPLSVMAVVCGDRLIYGVWGDENGNDGPHPVVGEASISLATACFGNGMTGNNGHDENDVLYIAFPGDDAVPGAGGANWGASSYAAFENSIQDRGNKLIQRIGGGGGGGGGNDCSWPGHCEGASCNDENDCSDDLVCKNGKCAKP